MKNFPVPRGTNDILPSEIPLWLNVESKARHLLRTYGYQEIRTPLFEETELFARSMGETSDVVQKQMLNLAASHREDAEKTTSASLSLRPESTAAVVRSYIQHHFDQKENLTKLFYIGPMFRGERPQKGRLRQFHQIGVEAIGPESSLAYLDAEVISLSVHLLRSLGLKNFRLKLNTLGSPDDKKEFSRQLREELRNKISDLCEDCQGRFERNVFRILDCKNKTCREIVSRINIGHSYLSQESQVYYVQVKEALESLGIVFEESFNLVRGLDYYTHTVFEITDSSLGSQDALGAGGRYNNLVSQLGGPQADAVGFALGVERILLAMAPDGVIQEAPLTVYMIAMNEESYRKAFEILHLFRGQGISADMNYRLASMKSQMRSANKIGARYVAILGEEELRQNAVTVKDMTSGTQETIAVENLTKVFKEKNFVIHNHE
ncbi:MAG TPA: histidine--tRNA ligase [Candidatus Omnitrophica bacterium]|nr:MAG: histidine--tRNA ligase [Omnitrophica WOR_2 bacterium GWA2_45_18]HBR14715.1 histidine--tRNA ligase [Candidatus Omnitrophota bacterium]